MRVSDIDQTLQFYREVLGLEVVEQKVSPRGSQLAFLAVPNSEELIELCSFPTSGPVKVQEDLVHLAFEVDDLDGTIQELQAKDVPITDGPTQSSSGSRFIFIDAPDGYEIELIQRAPGVAMGSSIIFPSNQGCTFLKIVPMTSYILERRGCWLTAFDPIFKKALI
jgi:lactoylglutathione lyase